MSDFNLKYAIPGALFFVTFAVMMADAAPYTRPMLLAGLLLAGAGQFVAQMGTSVAYRMALVLTYFAMFLALSSLVYYMLTLIYR